jgi:hypothetical protein
MAEQAKYVEDREFFLKIADIWALIAHHDDPSFSTAPRKQNYEIRDSAGRLCWRIYR